MQKNLLIYHPIAKNKELFYRPIYNLDAIKLDKNKIYLSINQVNDFIKFLQFFARESIFLIYISIILISINL